MIQATILILGGLSILCLASKHAKIRKYGHISGLASEPFWFYTALVNDQWAIMILAVWYGGCYIQGLRNTWTKESN